MRDIDITFVAVHHNVTPLWAEGHKRLDSLSDETIISLSDNDESADLARRHLHMDLDVLADTLTPLLDGSVPMHDDVTIRMFEEWVLIIAAEREGTYENDTMAQIRRLRETEALIYAGMRT